MSYSSALHLVRGVKSRLASSGVAADALFAEAGLSEGEGLACDALTLSDKLSHLWELVVAQSGDPLIGLKISSPHRLGWLGVMGHIMLVSPTVQSSIERCHGNTRVGLLLPGAQRVVRAAASGELGDIIEVEAGFLHSSDLNPDKAINWKRMEAVNGRYGCMGDLGMHVLHVPLRLGWRPATVHAQLRKLVHERPDGKGGRVPCTT